MPSSLFPCSRYRRYIYAHRRRAPWLSITEALAAKSAESTSSVRKSVSCGAARARERPRNKLAAKYLCRRATLLRSLGELTLNYMCYEILKSPSTISHNGCKEARNTPPGCCSLSLSLSRGTGLNSSALLYSLRTMLLLFFFSFSSSRLAPLLAPLSSLLLLLQLCVSSHLFTAICKYAKPTRFRVTCCLRDRIYIYCIYSICWLLISSR